VRALSAQKPPDEGASSLPSSRSPLPIVSSPALRAIFQQAERVAHSDVPTLITGATGTGKEVIARHIHETGVRHSKSFCAVNCGALPEHLVEASLFGHVRGAFTSADRESIGLFREADGGTLFLDEVAELSATAQVVLLRVLETQLVRPVWRESRSSCRCQNRLSYQCRHARPCRPGSFQGRFVLSTWRGRVAHSATAESSGRHRPAHGCIYS
jgi:DNA-binding NtrC family response regulator